MSEWRRVNRRERCPVCDRGDWCLVSGPAGDLEAVVCPPMGGRDYQLWQPLLAIASFIEDAGVKGLLNLMQDHALDTIETAKDDQTPDCDETLLRILAGAIAESERPTCGEILNRARDIDPQGFKPWSEKGVSSHLKRYGLHTNKTGGWRRYSKVTLDDLRQIERSYGVDLGV